MPDSLCIAIDIGNSATKIGLVNPDKLSCIASDSIPTQQLPLGLEPRVGRLLKGVKIKRLPIVVSRVAKFNGVEIDSELAAFADGPILRVTNSNSLPIKINYDPATAIGSDRVADLLYAHAACKDSPVIVVDAGTAINIESLSENREYAGGAILPGVGTQFFSLHLGTEALPQVSSRADYAPSPGFSTVECIELGVLLGAAGAVTAVVGRLVESLSVPPRILTCGGEWNSIAPMVGFEYQEVPHLTLIGIGLYAKY